MKLEEKLRGILNSPVSARECRRIKM